MPQGLERDSQKTRPLGEKQAGYANTVAQMLPGSGARGLGAGLSLKVGSGGRSRLPGALSQQVSLTPGWPGLSSGYQDKVSPSADAGWADIGQGGGGGLSWGESAPLLLSGVCNSASF